MKTLLITLLKPFRKYIYFIVFLILLGAGGAIINQNLYVTGTITANGEIISTKLVKRYTVGTKGTFLTPNAAIAWLSIGGNMNSPVELLCDGGTHLITDSNHVEFAYPLAIRGLGTDITIFKASTGLTGKAAFNCYSSVVFNRISWDGSNLANWGNLSSEIFCNVKGAASFVEFNDCIINKQYIGVRMSNASELLCSYVWFKNSVDEGIGIYNTTTTKFVKYTISNGCRFSLNNKDIEFVDGDSIDFLISGNDFINAAADTSIYFKASPGVTTNASTAITNNSFSETTNALVGIDFTLAGNANIFVKNNVNLSDKNPSGYFEVAASTTLTTITTLATWTKLTWDAYDIATAVKLGASTVNEVVYLPSNTTNLKMVVTISIQIDAGASSTIEVGIVKNPTFNVNNELTAGTVLTPMEKIMDANDRSEIIVLAVEYYDVAKNDKFVLVAKNSKKEDLRVTRMNGMIF